MKPIKLPSFLMFRLPSYSVSRNFPVTQVFEILQGPTENPEVLSPTKQQVVFELPNGKFGVYSKECLFPLDFSFTCPFCRRKIQFSALMEFFESEKGVEVVISSLERVYTKLLEVSKK